MVSTSKKIKEIKETPDWKKRFKVISLFLLTIFTTFAIGSFYPNPYTKHTIKLQIETEYTNWANDLGLQEPSFEYTNDLQFIKAVRKCVDWVNFETPRLERVPSEMIVGMAALESGWGTSRFALEGNNLFGIRTYDKKVPHMLIQGHKKWRGWGVRIFNTKCQGVQFFVELLNNHSAYEEFRDTRWKMNVTNQKLDPIALVKTLKAYSTTEDYAQRVEYIILKIRKQEEKASQVDVEVKSDSKVKTETKPKEKPTK